MIYDQYGAAISAEFEMFTGALKLLYLQTSRASAGMESAHGFRMLGLAEVVRFMQRATGLTDNYLSNFGSGVVNDRDTPVLNTLRGIAIKNVNDLSVDMMAPASRVADLLTRPAGAVGLLLQKRLTDPQFTAIDKSGRKWQAALLVKTVARDFAYQAYIDFQAAQIIASGANAAEVVWMDPTPAGYGTIVLLADLARARARYFHPNATAQLRAAHVPT